MNMKKSTAALCFCILATSSVAFGQTNLSQGEAIFKEMLEKLVSQTRLGCRLSFDASGKQNGRVMKFSGKVKMAFDSSNPTKDRKKIDVDTTISGNPVKAILNSEGQDFYFVATLPVSLQWRIIMMVQEKQLQERLLTGFGGSPSDFDGSSMENPLSEVMGSVGEGFTPENRKALVDNTFKKAQTKSQIVYIAPNCLKFIPKDKSGAVTKVYYNTSTKLIQTVMVQNPAKGMTGKLVFSDWILGQNVDTSLARPRGAYREFDQQAMGKLLGAGMSAMSGSSPSDQNGANPFGGGSNPFAGGNPFAGANPYGDSSKNNGSVTVTSPEKPATPSGFTFPSFGGAIQTPNTRSASGQSTEEALKGATNQLQNMMKAFNSEEFKQQMMKVKEAAMAAERKLNSPEFKKQMEDAKRVVEQGQAKINSPEGQKELEDTNAKLKEMQEAMQRQMNAIMNGNNK